jgi:DNA polymerase III epsilon subunit-like protein
MYLIIDSETTGLPIDYNAPINDIDNWPRLVQIAYQVLSYEEIKAPHSYDERLLRVHKQLQIVDEGVFIICPEGFTIPNSSTNIHGITNEIAYQEGLDLTEVLDMFPKIIDRYRIKELVGHNIKFDFNIIASECYRLEIDNPLDCLNLVCTMDKSIYYCGLKDKYGNIKRPKLVELYYYLFEKQIKGAHSALNDVRATSECFRELKKRKVIQQDKHKPGYFAKEPYFTQGKLIEEFIMVDDDNCHEFKVILTDYENRCEIQTGDMMSAPWHRVDYLKRNWKVISEEKYKDDIKRILSLVNIKL